MGFSFKSCLLSESFSLSQEETRLITGHQTIMNSVVNGNLPLHWLPPA